MWIEEHSVAGLNNWVTWFVARRWERSPVGYVRHTRYLPKSLEARLHDNQNPLTMEDLELQLFGSVIPTKK